MSGERPGWLDDPVVPVENMSDREVLIRMDGKLTSGLSSLYDANQDIRKTLADHETRMRAIEKRQWYFAGVAAVVSLLANQYLGPLLAVAAKH